MNGFNFDEIPKQSPSKLSGSDGVVVYAGRIYDAEKNTKLIGSNKWLTFDNILQGTLPVVAAFRAFDTFLRSANWIAEPNPLGGAKAEKMAEIATEGLLNAPLPKPWSDVVGKIGTGAAFRGHSLHEWQGSKRATPGAPWHFTNIEERPQHTIDRWIKPDERTPWIGVVQRTQSGHDYPIARAKLLHVADDAISNNPEGTGYLRHLFEFAERYKRFNQLEAYGYESNLAGTPIFRVPMSDLRAQAVRSVGEDETKIAAYIDAQLVFVDKFLNNHIMSPTRGLRLSSEPYVTQDDKVTPSAVLKWTFDVVKATGMSFAELRDALAAIGKEILRVMGCEWLAMGDSEGARSVHENKTQMFALIINSLLKRIGYYATAQLAYPMTALNGFDPETCTPRIKPSPIPMASIQQTTEALESAAKAGCPFPPDWEGWNVVLGREELPPIDLERAAEDAMLARDAAAAALDDDEDDDDVPEPAADRKEKK